ncbi:MAG: 50S ribosomal protein L23 [Alphaproteobacteria bacterium]|jgi:large subunit ribosomal protein L23|nr:50S ribosomal protein L23 [Alphaproteobacteria bacterium]
METRNKERLFEVIRNPIITEKTTLLSGDSKIVFAVAPTANKKEIKEAVEFLFKVKVEAVNTINQNGKLKMFKGKLGKRKNYRKAIVTLAKGQTIDLASGV